MSKYTLVIGLLKVRSRYIENKEVPAEGGVFNTVQFFITPTVIYRIVTFALDHDVHIYLFKNLVTDNPIAFAKDHINKHYGDILREVKVIPIENLNDAESIRNDFEHNGLGNHFDLMPEKEFLFWKPDSMPYSTKTRPEDAPDARIKDGQFFET